MNDYPPIPPFDAVVAGIHSVLLRLGMKEKDIVRIDWILFLGIVLSFICLCGLAVQWLRGLRI